MNQTASITRIKYGATVLLNADTDYRQYNPGDALVYDNRTLLEISEDSVSEALDEAFRIGNRMGADREGTEWSSNVRSVSVGDVIYVNRTLIDEYGDVISSGMEGYYSVDRLGFTRLDREPRAEYSTEAMVRTGVAAE